MNGLIKKVTIELHDGTLIESEEIARFEMTNVVQEKMWPEMPYRCYEPTGVTKWLTEIVCRPPLNPDILGGSESARKKIPFKLNDH